MPTQPEIEVRPPADPEGVVFDIQRFSVHDGPGIRTTVFLKGCPLRCLWCHNPESQRITFEISFERELCVLCGNCAEACPEGAQRIADGKRFIRRQLCTGCGRCLEHCYTNALVLKGKTMTVPEVLEEAIKDKRLYEKSGGGITLSGGEPAMQAAFSYGVLQAAKENGLHTALETCGALRWEVLEEMLEVTDLVIYDIKHADSRAHKRLTGAGNELIVSNLGRILGRGMNTLVRVPLIPGYNDDEGNVAATARLLHDLEIDSVEIIPYHDFASAKYELLDLEYDLKSIRPYTRDEIESRRRAFAERGIQAKIGI